MVSTFDEMYSQAVGSQLAELHGECVTYYPPTNRPDGFGQDRPPLEIPKAIVGTSEVKYVRDKNGVNKIKTQTISLCVDPNNPQYCGTTSFSMKGWIVIGQLRYGIDSISGDGVFQNLAIEFLGPVSRGDPNVRDPS